MPRRKIVSTRQKKADQQLKRAIKRGDVPPPDPKKPIQKRKRRIGPTGHVVGTPENAAQIETAKKLQSAFIKLPPTFLEETRNLASSLPLLRPIPNATAIYRDFDGGDESNFPLLTCPKRPKWRYEMSKLEVERNEEGHFKKWVDQTDETLAKWQNKEAPTPSNQYTEPRSMPRSPSYFERNLEVWRQLWRVSEISQIILVLLDSRCPTLHYPPSLSSYLADRKVILVLTKVDISGPARVEAWTKYIHSKYPEARIVQVESYAEKISSEDQQGPTKYEPSIPEYFRARLVQVIQEVHAELLEPPERVKNNPGWMKNWIPPVKRVIDWEGVLKAKGSKVGLAVGGATVPKPRDDQQSDTSENHENLQEPTCLTIGLIGQPNVGKSSLLNALFGLRKVTASRTPGKTKHFQTLYWTPDIRLVDCPGLVMPNYTPMEMQILGGILPISKVSAVPSSIYFVSQVLPLEDILNLVHPSAKLERVEDKRTWREDRKPADPIGSSDGPVWTAMDILTAYADAKGWLTAKAGRPDVHRAGNALLRAVAEGRIGWGFWPPETALDEIKTSSAPEHGIWIPRSDKTEEGSDLESEEEHQSEHHTSESEESGEQEEDEEDSNDDEQMAPIPAGIGRFGALAIHNSAKGNVDNDESSEESSG